MSETYIHLVEIHGWYQETGSSERVQYFAWLGGSWGSTHPGLSPAVPWDTSGHCVHSAASADYTPSDCSCHTGSKRLMDGVHQFGIQSVASCLQGKNRSARCP